MFLQRYAIGVINEKGELKYTVFTSGYSGFLVSQNQDEENRLKVQLNDLITNLSKRKLSLSDQKKLFSLLADMRLVDRRDLVNVLLTSILKAR